MSEAVPADDDNLDIAKSKGAATERRWLRGLLLDHWKDPLS
ncbi:hypothetical protein [Bradyrhizobium sp.]